MSGIPQRNTGSKRERKYHVTTLQEGLEKIVRFPLTIYIVCHEMYSFLKDASNHGIAG
jgi:hypothetical protein